MKNWKIKEGQKLDTNALPSDLRSKASLAFSKGSKDDHKVSYARQDIAAYFEYVADSRNISLARIVHAFKTGRLGTIAPTTVGKEEATATA